MNLSFNEWNFPTKEVKKQLLALNPSGLLAHTVGNVLTIFLEDEKKGFNMLASWAPFEHGISAMCWYDATDIPEVAVPILVLASTSKKVVIYDICAQRNIVAFNLTGDEPATIIKWSPISSSRFFIGTGSGELHCCSLILGKETQFNIEWTINLDFRIDFISFEPSFSDNILVASKSGQLNFIKNIHSMDPIIMPENYTLCGENNEIFSCDFFESSSNYLLVVSKLGTVIYAIEQQESFNLFKDHKLKYLYPVQSNGERLIGINNESISLYESIKGNFHRLYELPICPNVSNLPAYQTEFVFNYDRVIFVSYNWWLTTVKLIKNKLFVTHRVRLIPDKPIDFSFRMRSIAICTRNGCILSTKSNLANAKQNSQKTTDPNENKKNSQQQKNKDEFDIPREDSDTNLADLSNDITADLEKIATRSIIYHQRRRSFGTMAKQAPSKVGKDPSQKTQKPAFELIRETYSVFSTEKKSRNSDMLNKPDTTVHGRKSNYALKKGPIDLSAANKNDNPKIESNQQPSSQQPSTSQTTRSSSNPTIESPKKKIKPKTNEQQIKFVETKTDAPPSSKVPEKKESIPKFNTPASPPQQSQEKKESIPKFNAPPIPPQQSQEKKESIPKFNTPPIPPQQSQEKKESVPKFNTPPIPPQQSQEKKESVPKFNIPASQQPPPKENKDSIPKTSISVPSFTSPIKPPTPKTQFTFPSNSPESQSQNQQNTGGEALPSMAKFEPFRPPSIPTSKGSPTQTLQFQSLQPSKNIHADPNVLNQSRRLRSMSMHPGSASDNNAIKQIAENARKHYKNINDIQEDFTTMTEFGNSRTFYWCFKVCDIPLTKIEWLSATKLLAFGTQMRGPHYVHHLYLVDLRLRSVTRVLGDRLNAINLPFTSLVINRYQKICAIVLGDTLVMFISFYSSTPKMIGSMSFDSKVIVSFSPTPESTKALIVCQNDVVFIDYDLKNGTIRQTEKCSHDVKKTITAALWKRMSLVLGDIDGNIIIVSFSPYHREDCLNLKNEIVQITNHTQGTMLVIDSKNTAYIMSPRKIDFTFPYPVSQIHQFTNNDFVIRGCGKGSLSVISIKGKYHPTYTSSIVRCMILKPRTSWMNLLKIASSNIVSSNSDSDLKFIELAEQFGIPLVRKILITLKHPNFAHEQIQFIRDIVITNNKLIDLTVKLSLMLGDYDTARIESLRTEKNNHNYILNIYKSILLRSSPEKDIIRESVMQLFLDDMYEEGVDLFMIFGMWQEAVSKLVTIGNMKEAMSLLMLKIKDNQEDREFMKLIDKKLIESDYLCMGLTLVALSGGLKLVIDKYRDLGEFEQASFLEKIAK